MIARIKSSALYALLFMSMHAVAQVPEGKKVISSLYIYDLTSGKSTLILEEERHFEAPNWSRDGKYLLIKNNIRRLTHCFEHPCASSDRSWC